MSTAWLGTITLCSVQKLVLSGENTPKPGSSLLISTNQSYQSSKTRSILVRTQGFRHSLVALFLSIFYRPIWTVVNFAFCRSRWRWFSQGLLRRQRQVQLECQRRMRHARVDRLCRPISVRELGRGSLHGGHLPVYRQWVALWSFRWSTHTQRNSPLIW
jgi:hypothetical protein